MTPVHEGLTYAESPRWYDGAIYLSDVHAYRVVRLGLDGTLDVVVDAPGRPAGLGFTPDDELVVATALDRRVSVVREGSLEVLADLSGMVTGLLNDMVVTREGAAYVGATGFNLMAGEDPRPGQLVLLGPDREPRVVSDEVMFPNGVAVDGERLVLAETGADRLSQFTMLGDGSLGPRETWCELPGSPDGLSLDEDGGAWVALLREGAFVHVARDGTLDRTVDAPGSLAVACVSVGPARDRLALCSAYTTMEELAAGRSRAAVHLVDLDVPGSGTP